MYVKVESNIWSNFPIITVKPKHIPPGLVQSGIDFSVAEEENNDDANKVGKDVLGNGDVISVNMVPLHMRNTSLKSTSTA